LPFRCVQTRLAMVLRTQAIVGRTSPYADGKIDLFQPLPIELVVRIGHHRDTIAFEAKRAIGSFAHHPVPGAGVDPPYCAASAQFRVPVLDSQRLRPMRYVHENTAPPVTVVRPRHQGIDSGELRSSVRKGNMVAMADVMSEEFLGQASGR